MWSIVERINMKKIVYSFAVLFLIPSLAHAALGNLWTLTERLTDIVKNLIPITFSFALAVFFWGLARYLFNSDSEESKAEGRRIMTGGIVALFIMSSLWGIVMFVAKDLGLDKTKESMGVPNI